MNSKRLYYVLVATIMLLFVGLIAGAYGVNSILVKRANSLTTLKAKSLALGRQQDSLLKAKRDLKTYSELEKIARTVVPQDKNQAEAVREIVNLAEAHNISLASITFPSSTLGTLPNGAAASKSGAGGSTASAPTPSPSAGKLSQLTPVKNIPGVYELPITVTSDTSSFTPYKDFVGFLQDLEHNRRTAQVSSITITPNPKDRSELSFTLNISEYIKP